nr:craniofacial development protein 1 [Bactrocera oleae]XP_036226110.1 craniofacial development protein 1 [Bactrocera oleae]
MNPEVELHDSDESDSDFCPEKEAGIEVSEEASSEVSSCSDEEESSPKNTHKKPPRKNSDSTKKQVKKVKSRKRARAQEEAHSSDTDDEHTTAADSERKHNTRQTDAAKRLCSGKEKDTLESEEEDKSRSDALWADFLSDVKPKNSEPTTKTTTQANHSTAVGNGVVKAGVTNGLNSPKKRIIKSEEKCTSDKKPAETKKPDTVTVTEILDFAGEEVRIEKVVNADSVKENKEAGKRPVAGTSALRAGLPVGLKRPMAGGSSSGGLGSILNQIGKKKKISVLEKSQLDWKSFKQNEGIEEELQTFNKGKDGYLERQDFLQRTDLRQFEIEKNLRQSRRND